MKRGRPTKLQSAMKTALVDYLGVLEDEAILFIADPPQKEIAYEFYKFSKEYCAESFFLEIDEVKRFGQEPPKSVAEMMKTVDAVIAITSKSITHTKAKREATKVGVRMASMPALDPNSLIRLMDADINILQEIAQKTAERLKSVQEVRIESKLGTNITLPIKRRKVTTSLGLLKNIGDSGNLPSGEVFCGPWEDQTNGVIVFDGSIAGLGLLKTPVKVKVKDGYISDISGGEEAKAFEEILKSIDNHKAYGVAEFGIGTNYKARLTGNILEDVKVMGTVHIGFGNNLAMGGKLKVSSHIDGVLKDPIVYFDKEIAIEKGRLLFLDEDDE